MAVYAPARATGLCAVIEDDTYCALPTGHDLDEISHQFVGLVADPRLTTDPTACGLAYVRDGLPPMGAPTIRCGLVAGHNPAREHREHPWSPPWFADPPYVASPPYPGLDDFTSDGVWAAACEAQIAHTLTALRSIPAGTRLPVSTNLKTGIASKLLIEWIARFIETGVLPDA